MEPRCRVDEAGAKTPAPPHACTGDTCVSTGSPNNTVNPFINDNDLAAGRHGHGPDAARRAGRDRQVRGRVYRVDDRRAVHRNPGTQARRRCPLYEVRARAGDANFEIDWPACR